MDWLIAALVALLDEMSEQPTGAFRSFLDERTLGLVSTLAETRREAARAADGAAASLGRDAELIHELLAEIAALNREIVDLKARSIDLHAAQLRLQAQHESDRAHIRELIAEMVRRDIR